MVDRAAFSALLPPSSRKKSRKNGYINFIKPGSDAGDSERVMAVDARPGKTTWTLMFLDFRSAAKDIDMASITLLEWV